MISDKSERSKDKTILEEYNINDIDNETLKDYRAMFRVHKGDAHKWNSLNDEDFLCLLNAIDRKSRNLTLAGLLMFGKKEDILYEYPSFFLDYREVEEISHPQLRWKNRITSMDDNLPGNIWSFFSKIVNRITADIEVPFALNEKMMRIENTPVHESVREALANTLVHFQIGETGTTIIEKGEKYFKFSNPGSMRVPINEAFEGGKSDPRNPILHQMFSQLGYGERAGTGLYNIKTVWKEKDWIEPEIKEDLNPNRTTLILKMIKKIGQEMPNKNITNHLVVVDSSKDKIYWAPNKRPINSQEINILKLSKVEKNIINIIKSKPNITQKEISSELKISKDVVKRNLKKLKDKKIIKRVGARKNGHWEFI